MKTEMGQDREREGRHSRAVKRWGPINNAAPP